MRSMLTPALALLAALATSPATGRAAVVVELFTAQGCSSCPPADRLLSAMGNDPELGRRVLPLAFHVDYWNHEGWRDPFSSRAWSQRQERYQRPTGADGIYTPQAVINGRRQCLGSDVGCIRAAVEAAAGEPAGSVEVRARDGAAGKLRVELSAAPPSAHAGELDVMLAVVESGLETPVGRGENANRVLHNDFVVRKLQRAFVLAGAARRGTVEVALEAGWQRANVRVAVFLQDPRSRRILGAASAALVTAASR